MAKKIQPVFFIFILASKIFYQHRQQFFNILNRVLNIFNRNQNVKNLNEIQKSGPDSLQRRLTRRGHLWCAPAARFVLALHLITLVVHDAGDDDNLISIRNLREGSTRQGERGVRCEGVLDWGCRLMPSSTKKRPLSWAKRKGSQQTKRWGGRCPRAWSPA